MMHSVMKTLGQRNLVRWLS